MNKALIAVFAAVLALGLAVGDAEAARLGGGRSVGMQRQSVAPRPTAPAQQATPAAPTSSPTAAQTPKRSWMGPLAGLAAGLGLGALMSQLGFGPGMANFLMIVLIAMAALFVFRLLFRRQAPPPERGVSPSTYPAEPMEYTSQQPLQPSASATPAYTANIPTGFDSEGFLRVAKLNFVRLQAANDTKNVDDIREFTSPELFAEIRMQMDERGNAPQQTDVVTLNAELLEVASEGNRHVASVLFSGMIREQTGAAAAPFGEIWNLVKPDDGSRGWTVAGIQQVH
jgi:predicted lipid-binding transport protein (Tim44 family)